MGFEQTTLPPGPKLPGIVQTGLWLLRPTEFLDQCAGRYGDIFTLRLFATGGTVVMTSHPEAIRRIFAATYEEVWQTKARELTEVVGPASLFTLDGQEHARMRRLMAPAFGWERMRDGARLVEELTDEAIDSWPLGAPFAMQPALRKLILRTTLHTLLGRRDRDRLERLFDLFSEASGLLTTPWMLIPIELQRRIGRGPWPRFMRLVDAASELLYDELRERRAIDCGDEGDVLSALLTTRDADGRPLRDDELRDALMSLFLVGHDTTASAVSWAIHRLLHEPVLCARLRDELRTVDGGGDRYERLLSLPLLDATIREVLRLHPIFPGVHRDLLQPMSLLGYRLPAGTRVAAGMYLAQRRADVYPEPERFLPDRFLAQRPTANEWFPFGGGMRRCAGSPSAQVQMKIVIATILRRAALQPVPVSEPRTVRVFISLAPSSEVPAILRSRAPRHLSPSVNRAQVS